MTDYYSRARERYIEQPRQQEEEERALFGFGDTLAAPFRGAEAFAQDAYGLADTLTGDRLPDYDTRLLGESKTTVGGAVEGASNFLAGFIPFLGIAGKAGKVAGLSGKGLTLFKGASAGAAADFVGFSGTEARLSNLIESSPALSNAVTGYLAADGDDTELEGRLKNVIEGAGLGVATEALFRGIRGLKRAGKADTPEAAEEAMSEAARELRDLDGPDLDVDLDSVADRISERVASNLGDGTPGRFNPRTDLSTEELAEQGLDPSKFNLSTFSGTDEAVATFRAVEEKVAVSKPSVVQTHETWEETYEASATALEQLTGGGTETRAAMLARVSDDARSSNVELQELTARINAQKMMLDDAAEGVSMRVNEWEAAGRPAESKAAIIREVQVFRDFAQEVRGADSQIGRQLNYLKRNRVAPSTEGIQRAIDSGAYGDFDKVIDDILNLDDFGAISRTLDNSTAWQKFVAVTNEFRISALLYGPQTQIVNALSGALMTVYQPLEKMIGTAGLAIIGKPEARAHFARFAKTQYAGEWLTGLKQSTVEAWRFAGKALKEGQSKFTAESFDDLSPRQRAISSNRGGATGGAINFLGSIMTVPTKLMASSDEFFKQFNGRSTLRMSLLEEGYDSGLRGQALHRDIDDKMQALVKEGQLQSLSTVEDRARRAAAGSGLSTAKEQAEFIRSYVDNNWDESYSAISEAARDKSLSVTFQTPLEGLARDVQNLVLRHPELRIVMPFIRTPVNLLGYGFGRTALAPAKVALDARNLAGWVMARKTGTQSAWLAKAKTKLGRKLMSGDVNEQAEALGQLSAAVSFSLVAMNLASSARITGRGPADPEQRQVMEAAGWLPYSVFLGKDPLAPQPGEKYVAFGRLDPFATVFGIYADMFDTARFADVDEQESMETWITGMAIGLANNFTNKTFLQGIAEATETLSDPGRYMRGYQRRLVGSFVPNVLGQGVSVWDENLRSYEAVGTDDPLMDYGLTMRNVVMAKIPGLSNTLEPRRDVLGQTRERRATGWLSWINPIAYSEVSDSKVRREFDEIGHGLTPPRPVKNGLDLRDFVSGSGQSAYDRWGELQGKVAIGGRTLDVALRKLISTAAYQRMPKFSTSDIDSPRIAEIKRVIRRYNHAAWRQTLREFPDLRVSDRNQFLKKRQRKLGLGVELAGLAA